MIFFNIFLKREMDQNFTKSETPFSKSETSFRKPEAYKSLNSSSTLDVVKKDEDEDEENIFDTDASTVFYEMVVSLKNLFVSND